MFKENKLKPSYISKMYCKLNGRIKHWVKYTITEKSKIVSSCENRCSVTYVSSSNTKNIPVYRTAVNKKTRLAGQKTCQRTEIKNVCYNASKQRCESFREGDGRGLRITDFRIVVWRGISKPCVEWGSRKHVTCEHNRNVRLSLYCDVRRLNLVVGWRRLGTTYRPIF